ncbi:MAG TPA: PPC domain-containing DNA-binding protein [Thermomicrobiales bacterium]|nr:PPC domain-containing DNA-binding protein [Thermomicrobiales bacterium]
MEILEDRQAGIVIAVLRRGELILESLREVARRADIHSGVVMSGIGSVTKARIHTVITNDYPPTDEFIDLAGPLEVVQFGGVIADYQPHIHISLWDRDKRYHGGHLEEGCEILALSEISIHRLPALRLTRRAADESGIMLLSRE